MGREAGYALFPLCSRHFAAARHKVMPCDHTCTQLLCCSFTCIRVTTLCGPSGRWSSGRWRWWRRKALTGAAISAKLEAFSACTSIATGCVHALLGTWLLLATLIHIWQTERGLHECELTETAVVMQMCVGCVYLFGIGNPSSRADMHIGWVLSRCLHSHRVAHTRL